MKDNFGIPEIFEEEAIGALGLVYQDIKCVLKVPIVNFIFRTLALYDKFLFTAWREVRNNMLTINVEKAAESLRYPNISAKPPQVNWRQYYKPHKIDTIRKIIFTFNYVNTKLLLISSAWAESLGNRPICGGKEVKGFISPGLIPELPEITMVDMDKVANPIRNLLLDISRVHHTFDLASDYRALAYYPEFLSVSWEYLKPYADTEEYTLIRSDLKERSISLAHTMPFPVTINRQGLESYYSAQEIAGIMGVVSMFQNFLPGLIIDGEFFRRILF